MITIKIKTWKDWKKDFIDWAQAARRKTCKEYVNYMEEVEKRTVHKAIANVCDKYGNISEEQIQAIAEAADERISDCAKGTRKLIDMCQPIKFF